LSIPVLLDVVTIDASNGGVRVREGATTATATIAPGTYSLRGDGVADDLWKAFITALQAATASANTYSGGVVFDSDPASPTAEVTFSRATGSDSFQILWADALTTADPAWWGFTDANTALDAADKVSTLSPSSCWVSPCAPERTQPKRSADAYVIPTNGGRISAGKVGGPWVQWRFDLSFIDGKRFDEAHVPADPDRALSRFWARAIQGAPFEYHLSDESSAAATTLGGLSSSTLVGTWHLHEDSVSDFEGARFDNATSLWSIQTLFRKRVT